MVQDFTAFRKISFQTVDVEVALAEIEYQYLKFVCEATLRNSDEVLREQIRQLQIAGLPSFDEWRKQEIEAVRGILSPSIEATTIPTTAIESSDSAVETLVEPPGEKTSERAPSEPSTSKAKQTKAKPPEKPSETTPSKAVETLVQSLSEPAMAKLTSREVIEQQHEQLTVLLKEGKTMDDLAALLTSNGAKISASTLRNYLSAARRKAKTGNATAKKKASPVATLPAVADQATETTNNGTVEPSIAAEPSIAEAPTEPSIVPPKPTRGRPKAAVKSTLDRETSVASTRPRQQPSPLDVSPVPRRRKGRI
ncbi:MAG: hypothetical protein KME42_15500 [Tildeniella nuda ZEHNDER 1965/U140]|nr:hypothetical protein [Tildeniella nuda ZEHNDER 1965/U140]